MKPWIIERIEQERRERESHRIPLRIHQPPPEWIEEQERLRREELERRWPQRGVCIIDM